jgi:hypothetical protein
MHDKPPLPEITQEDWAATPPAVCAVVVALLMSISVFASVYHTVSGSEGGFLPASGEDLPQKRPDRGTLKKEFISFVSVAMNTFGNVIIVVLILSLRRISLPCKMGVPPISDGVKHPDVVQR